MQKLLSRAPPKRGHSQDAAHISHLTQGETYDRRRNLHDDKLSAWNENRRGVIELDAPARAYLGDAEITDRDRIAFALRELRSVDTTQKRARSIGRSRR